MASLEDCFQCSRQAAGTCVGFLASYIPICCCCCYYPYKSVGTNQIGLKKQFGKFKQTCRPGLNYFNPCTEWILLQNMQTNMVDMRNQKVFTKDNIGVTIDAVTFYRVIDPVRASFVVNDLVGSIVQITFVTLRVVCGEYVMCLGKQNLQDVLEARARLTEEIEQFVRRSAAEWGTLIERVLIKDMKLSPMLQGNLSIVSKTKRLCQSRIISAKADLESAKLYRQAADIMDTRAAMQIRFLDTLSQTQKKSANKLLILPLDAEQPLDLS